MKRPRSSTKRRVSNDAAELIRLAIGLSESGSRLEDLFWERKLILLIDQMLESGAEDDLNAALDHFYESNGNAYNVLADMVEGRSESAFLMVSRSGPEPSGGSEQFFDAQLFAAPILAWSRYAIPAGPLSRSSVETLTVQLGAHVFARDAQLALVDYLFSPDQMPPTFVATRQLLNALAAAALTGKPLCMDSENLPETNPFLSDTRYLIGAVVVPRDAALFRWNEPGATRESSLKEWSRQGGPNLEPLLTGCSCQFLLPDAYHSARRQADTASREYSLKASIDFLHTTAGIAPAELRAVIAPFREERLLEEYRIGLGPRTNPAIYHGSVWPLLGAEDENSELIAEIEKSLHKNGVKEVVVLHHDFPFEFCDDCGAPLYPNINGETVHAEMPEETHPSLSQTLH
ncbi:MAG: DUF2863 family protein [Betaproteobacteria bacterium]|nr:DUF2863 family protein [Betaproteobacteria bacterium]